SCSLLRLSDVDTSRFSLIFPALCFFGEVAASAQSRLGDTRVRFCPVIDEPSQGSQPGFVASPARYGGAIDRLPGLPLAGGPHSPRVAFRAEGSGVPGPG